MHRRFIKHQTHIQAYIEPSIYSFESKILTLLIIQKMKKIGLTLTLLLFLHHLLNQLMTDYRVTKIIILLLVIFFLSFLIINHFLN